MKKLDQFTYRVTWSEDDGEFVGLCAEFPSLSFLAKTAEASLRGIRKVVNGVLQDMQASGEPIPEPISMHKYSGKFVVRVPPELHRSLVIEASEAGVSLNRLASLKLSRETNP